MSQRNRPPFPLLPSHQPAKQLDQTVGQRDNRVLVSIVRGRGMSAVQPRASRSGVVSESNDMPAGYLTPQALKSPLPAPKTARKKTKGTAEYADYAEKLLFSAYVTHSAVNRHPPYAAPSVWLGYVRIPAARVRSCGVLAVTMQLSLATATCPGRCQPAASPADQGVARATKR